MSWEAALHSSLTQAHAKTHADVPAFRAMLLFQAADAWVVQALLAWRKPQ